MRSYETKLLFIDSSSALIILHKYKSCMNHGTIGNIKSTFVLESWRNYSTLCICFVLEDLLENLNCVCTRSPVFKKAIQKL